MLDSDGHLVPEITSEDLKQELVNSVETLTSIKFYLLTVIDEQGRTHVRRRMKSADVIVLSNVQSTQESLAIIGGKGQ